MNKPVESFNPLDRVKFVQIPMKGSNMAKVLSFNPLDRVKFVQIEKVEFLFSGNPEEFQSPRSGQICSNEP